MSGKATAATQMAIETMAWATNYCGTFYVGCLSARSNPSLKRGSWSVRSPSGRDIASGRAAVPQWLYSIAKRWSTRSTGEPHTKGCSDRDRDRQHVDRAVFQLGDFAQRVERGVGEQVGRGFGVGERDEGGVGRHARVQPHRQVSILQPLFRGNFLDPSLLDEIKKHGYSAKLAGG